MYVLCIIGAMLDFSEKRMFILYWSGDMGNIMIAHIKTDNSFQDICEVQSK
jgi:hypothetical protein